MRIKIINRGWISQATLERASKAPWNKLEVKLLNDGKNGPLWYVEHVNTMTPVDGFYQSKSDAETSAKWLAKSQQRAELERRIDREEFMDVDGNTRIVYRFSPSLVRKQSAIGSNENE